MYFPVYRDAAKGKKGSSSVPPTVAPAQSSSTGGKVKAAPRPKGKERAVLTPAAASIPALDINGASHADNDLADEMMEDAPELEDPEDRDHSADEGDEEDQYEDDVEEGEEDVGDDDIEIPEDDIEMAVPQENDAVVDEYD